MNKLIWFGSFVVVVVVAVSLRSVLTFTEASEDDLGLYTIEAGDNSDLSSSYDFTAEGNRGLGVCLFLGGGNWQSLWCCWR